MSLKVSHVSGIDALYYFAQSGIKYNEFYEDLLEQIELRKKEFESINYDYKPNDIIIKINGIDVKHSGKSRDGFYWFNHEFFRIGFKDSEKALQIKNIRVQLNAVGIYTLGLKSVYEYVNTIVLGDDGVLSEDKIFSITRIDVNMFIQHNFNYLNKEMIVSKKKNHASTMGERSSAYELETYYVGQRPFLLRIYNKLKELKSAKQAKKEIMLNHFGINGLDINGDIFNVEFEFHREFLTRYGIDSVEDALSRAKSLFQMGCNLVRLIDVTSVSEKKLHTPKRREATTLPIWQYIHDSYDCTDFLQITTPMEKVEKITYRYSLEDARPPLKRIMNRLLLHDNAPTVFYFYEVMQQAKEEFENRHSYKIIEPDDTPSISEEFLQYSNDGLLNYEAQIYSDLMRTPKDNQLYDELSKLHKAIEAEISNRGLDDLF